MREQWLAMEHYRLHSVEEWPEGPRKEGALTAIRSTLESASPGMRARAEEQCSVCRSRARSLKLVDLPKAA